jgi:diaminopimelate decarboxylase
MQPPTARGRRDSEMNGAFKPSVIHRVARQFGTPFYLYDFDVIERQVTRLRTALGARFEIAFAVKANPSLAVLSSLSKQGLSADVASAGELLAARRAGFSPSKILATGPAKSDRDLEALVRARVSQIHVEGEWEMDALEAIARRLGRSVRVGLRLNPPWGIAEKRTIIGGPGATKFGFDLRSAERVLRMKRLRGAFPHLDVRGFQVFNASNVLSARLLVENTRRVLALALTLSKDFSVPLRCVDFGGGLGVPYDEGEEPLDLELLEKGLAGVAAAARAVGLPDSTRLVFEPGRFLVAEAGWYVTRVLGTKRNHGTDYVLLDGGIHHLLRPALFDSPHPVRLVAGRGRPRGRARRLVLAGPLCTGVDLLQKRVRLSLPSRGDLVAIGNAGAYGYTESMPLFLSHEWPAEVGFQKGRLAALRRPPAAKGLLRSQSTPRWSRH